MAIPTANFLSYNSTGISAVKCKFLHEICDTNNVNYVSLQEHFKYTKSTSEYFSDKFSNFYSNDKPSYRPRTQDSGRAKGGLAQLSSKLVNVRKDRIVTASWRVQAQLLNFQKTRVL